MTWMLRILVFHIQFLFLIPDSRTVYDLIFTLFILLTSPDKLSLIFGLTHMSFDMLIAIMTHVTLISQ